jgi:O-antigen ligase
VQDTNVYLKYGEQLARLSFVPGAPLRPIGMAAHSIYFEVLGDLGFTGLAFFLAMLVLALVSCGKIRKRARAHADMAWMSELAGMLRLSLIVYMVAGAALSFAYFEGVYVLVALLSVTQRMQSLELARRARAAPKPESYVLPVPVVSAPEWVPAWEQVGET